MNKATTNTFVNHYVQNVLLLSVASAFASHCAFGSMTIDEVRFSVTNKLVRLIHADDVSDWKSAMLSDGATTGMIAEACLECAESTKDSAPCSFESSSCLTAMSVFSGLADEGQIANLLPIAISTSNNVVETEAMLLYYSRTKGTMSFLCNCRRMLMGMMLRRSLRRLTWELLRREYESPLTSPTLRWEISDFARKAMISSNDPALMATLDKIRSCADPVYRFSQDRIAMMKRGMALSILGAWTSDFSRTCAQRYFGEILEDNGHDEW